MGPLTSFQHFFPLFVLSPLDLYPDGRVVGEAADIGTALACGTPYKNDCYCTTASASASAVSAVSAFIDDCASEGCFAGDRTRDISSVRSIYAAYCIGAGGSQPVVSEWYTTAEESVDEDGATATAEPSETEDSGPAVTTSDVTLVTHTTESESGSGATGVQE
ncbi:hypothetical protein FSOLCH5_014494 [Fusarium solani]